MNLRKEPIKRKQVVSILDALANPALFAPAFQPSANWRAWHAFLAALYALPMSLEDLEIYRRHTNRMAPPCAAAREAWLVVGRRGGKSRIAGLVAVFIACFYDYSSVLAQGEKGMVMVLAADRQQARVVFGHIASLIDGLPMLKTLVVARTGDRIELSNGITIEVHTASFRAVRGYTVVAAICDEIAFWRSEESANPDVEVLKALRPAMLTVPKALLLCISSPYAKRGALFEAYREHYGRDGDPVLVWQADTKAMNPTVSDQLLAGAYARDPSAAAAEYGAQFRQDIDAFIAPEDLDLVVVVGRSELRVQAGVNYVAFVDPSGGVGASMTLAIAHNENGIAVLDLIREFRAPFSPEQVVGEICELLERYYVSGVTGDQYGSEWVQERFRTRGFGYEVADKTKNELYRELLPLIKSEMVELLDDRRLIAQLRLLERTTSRGPERIGPPPRSHDDVANAVAGALVAAACGGPDSGLARMGLVLNPTDETGEDLEKDVRWIIRDHPAADHITGIGS
jgi:hypothetical protein